MIISTQSSLISPNFVSSITIFSDSISTNNNSINTLCFHNMRSHSVSDKGSYGEGGEGGEEEEEEGEGGEGEEGKEGEKGREVSMGIERRSV